MSISSMRSMSILPGRPAPRGTDSPPSGPSQDPVILTHTPAEPMDPVPTPDGRRIIFADGNDQMPNLTRDLFVVDADGQNLTQLTHRPQLSWEAAVSPDGNKLAYVVEKDGHSDIHCMSLDGTNDVNITKTNAGYWEPQWSPDGKQILVTSRDTANGNLELFLLAADGSGKQQITQSGVANNLSAHFTQDGSRIVYASDRREGMLELYSIKSDGSDLRSHTPGLMFIDGPSVSTDGHVAFSGLDPSGNIDLYAFSLNDTAPLRRLENSGMALSPRYSPDGAHLAYLAYDKQENMQIFEAKADGSDPQPLTHAHSFHIYPTYMPSGKSIVFVSDESGKSEVYRLDLNRKRVEGQQ